MKKKNPFLLTSAIVIWAMMANPKRGTSNHFILRKEIEHINISIKLLLNIEHNDMTYSIVLK